MQKRKYVHVKLIEEQILLMRAEGMTNREIADHFGLNLKQIKNWVNRHNRMQKNLAALTDTTQIKKAHALLQSALILKHSLTF